MNEIAIVGGGFSGALTALHLARQPSSAIRRIIVVEEQDQCGKGVAYGTTSEAHLLNVPAGKMSAFVDDPSHFLRWLNDAGHSCEEHAFVPRRLYGEYVNGLFETARRKGTIDVARGRVRDIEQERSRWRLDLESGSSLEADRVVIATGNAAPSPILRECPSEFLVNDPWRAGALDVIPPDQPVLLVGTGLTMIDVALELCRRGRSAPLFAISRRGLVPQGHWRAAVPSPPVDLAGILAAPRTMSGLTRAIVGAARDHAGRGGDWREVIDALRQSTSDLWGSLSHAERDRFLRHVRPFWDVHRHRVPPEALAAIRRLMTDRRMVVHAARIRSFTLAGRGIVVEILPRGSTEAVPLQVAHVVNCTGPDTDVSDDELWSRLVARGLARVDPLRLGVVTAVGGALVDQYGKASTSLFAMGSLRRPALWESTAVPELRFQAAELAKHLALPPVTSDVTGLRP